MSCNRGAHEATATLASVGVPAAETMAVYGNRRVGMTWEFLPRCPHCKKWVSPRTGICNYVRCPGKGTQVIENPPGYPPKGVRIVGSKRRVRQVLEETRIGEYAQLEGLPPLGSLNAEAMETIFDNAVVPDTIDAADEERWREEAAQFLEFAAEHGAMLPVSGQGMTTEEAYKYAQLGEKVTYPEDILAEATAIVDDAKAEEEFKPLPVVPTVRNLNDHRIDPEADEIGKGTPKQKYSKNIAAIRLLKELEDADRPATDEEKRILAGYVGWGGLAKVFDPSENYDWNKHATWKHEYNELKAMLTDAEYEAARATTPNAHYTSPTVVRGIWQGLERLGFKGGDVLEPAAGIGHFYGMMPEDMTHGSRRTAIELDDLTGRILGKLYPDADVHVAGYEDTVVGKDSMDVAVGNVPFGDYGVYDSEFDKPGKRHLSSRIHNYFFARALNDVKPGGVIAFVTSHYTLDAKNSRVREYLASQADLVGAVRLPNNAFKENAGTEVTTDIIFLRKRLADDDPDDAAWLDTVMVDSEDKWGYPTQIPMNNYFAEHPEMVLGDISAAGTMYHGEELTVTPRVGQDLAADLQAAIGNLPENVITTKPRVRCKDCGAFTGADGVCKNPMCPGKIGRKVKGVSVKHGAKSGAMVVKDGKVYRHTGEGLLMDVKTRGDDAERIGGILDIRDKARAVLALNLASASDTELKAAQIELNTLYDEFVTKYGVIHDPKHLKLLKGEPDLPFLVAMEEKDAAGEWQKAAFFSKRTMQAYTPPEHTDNAKDALVVSLNEMGGMDWGRMASLTGKDESAVQAELLAEGRIFKAPSGEFVLSEEYLSGDVRAKLAAAETALRHKPELVTNVEALKKVLPEDVPYQDIKAQLGAAWIPTDYVTDFVQERMGLSDVSVKYLDSSGEYVLERGRRFNTYSIANRTTWAAGDLTAENLLKKVLDGKTAKVYGKDSMGKRYLKQDETLAAREMADKIKAEFETWVWEDEGRQKDLVERFNRTFNSEVTRKFDGSHLVLPGLTNEINLYPHQKDSIARIAHAPGNVLLGHIVGAGKTFEMIGGAMEYRRLNGGAAMHAVPNHMLDQYSADVQRMYPNAKVLAVAAKDVGKKAAREELMNRIITGDYDAVVVTHDALNRIPMRAETEMSFIQEEVRALDEQLNAMNATGESKRSVKQIEKAKKRLKVKLKGLQAKQAKDDYGLTFEDLGIGIMNVDEAHMYKNLQVQTKRDRMSGIPQSGSARAFDMFMKTQYLSRRCKCGRFVGADGVCHRCLSATKIEKGKVVFATGTPIANSMAEAYVMQKMLMLDGLKEKGLHHFDAWANMFGTTQTAMELKPSGDGYREYTRWSKFNNVPELMRLFRTVADIKQDPDALGLERPELEGGEPESLSVPASEWLDEFIAECGERAEGLSHVDPTEDNMLKIVTDARKAALDARLIDPSLPDEPNSKVNAEVRDILADYKAYSGVEIEGVPGKQNMAQMIFLDMSTPTYKNQHKVYQEIMTRLGPMAKDGAALERVAAGVTLSHWQLEDGAALEKDLKESLSDIGLSGAAVDKAIDTVTGKFKYGEPIEDAGFNVYDDLKLKSIAGGIREHEIAFVHDAKNDAAKLTLFNKVNAGEVRVIIGSTSKMGTGTNAQRRLKVLSHLDAPWRPSDVEQREGRAKRQGNMNKAVKIRRRVTEGSFDTYMWQTLETKAKFIAQVMNNPDNPLREIEDLDAMVIGYAQMKALSTGNPIIIEQIEMETKMRKLTSLWRMYDRRQRELKRNISWESSAISRAKKTATRWQKFVDTKAKPPLSAFEIELDGKRYGAKTKRDAGKVFGKLITKYSSNKRGVVGTMNGYKIRLVGRGKGLAPNCEIEYEPGVTAPFDLGMDSTRNMTRLMNRVNDYPETAIAQNKLSAERAAKAEATYREELAKPFEQDEAYDATATRLREIEIELSAMQKEGDEMVMRSVEEDSGKVVITGEAADTMSHILGA